MIFFSLFFEYFKDDCGKAENNTIEFANSCWKYDNVSRLIPLDDKNGDILEIKTSYLQSFKLFDREQAKKLFEFSSDIKNYVDRYSKTLIG